MLFRSSLIAPDIVELQMNPGDLASLDAIMGQDVVSDSVTEVYQQRVAKCGARFAGSWNPEVYLVPDESLSQGRYRLRRGLPPGAPGAPDPIQPGYTRVDVPAGDPGRTRMDGLATVMEQIRPAVPVLRLVTGSSVAETSMSGARAGRGVVELELPNVPTVSREHARFTFADGRWWVTNQGMNGISVNGAPVSGKHPLSGGDLIRWGSSPDALLSRVEIG